MNETETALDLRAVAACLRRAAREVAAADRTEDALQALLAALTPSVADEGALFVIGDDGRLQHKASLAAGGAREAGVGAGERADAARREGEPSPAERAAVLAVRERAPAVLTDPEGAPAVLDSLRGSIEEVDGIAVPLLREERAVGALWLGRGPGRKFARSDLELLLDLGERVSLILDNWRLRREVRAAQRAKADFLAVVNHELRTPLTAVVGYADLLEAGIPGPVTEKQRRQLVRIKESAWDLLELIDGILGYARYEGENPDVNIRMVEPEKLLQDAVRVVEAAAEEKGLTVSIEAAEQLPAFPTDVEKARRILFHLLSNAVKFTPEGEVRVRISSDPEWVVFSVADTGIGIRPEERSAIFEPFWQGERPETRTTGGAGMGLSLAQKLTELLSGRIEVESEVGRGSTFTVRFPRRGPRPASL